MSGAAMKSLGALITGLICCGTLCFTADAQTSSTAPPARAVLLIQYTPGGAQVYVDDELLGTTGPEGRLRISTLKPGKHTLRLSLGGQSYGQGEINLVAGKSLTKAVTLEEQDNAPNPTAKPSLPQVAAVPVSDTLTWIGTHFETVERVDPSSGSSINLVASMIFQGCQATLTLNDTWIKQGKVWPNKTVLGPFEFSNLRPDTIKVRAEQGYISLHISAVNPTILELDVLAGLPAPTSGQMVRDLEIRFATQDMADRQAKAWHDAIIGCGGKAVSDKLY